MASEVTVFKGVVGEVGKRWGSPTQRSIDWLRSADGQRTEPLTCTPAMEAELDEAMARGEAIEAHFFKIRAQKPMGLMALRRADGRAVVEQVPPTPFILQGIVMPSLLIFGLLMLPLMGLGLVLLLPWRKLRAEVNALARLRTVLGRFPDATKLPEAHRVVLQLDS